MLRAYSKYLQQLGVPFSQVYVEQTFSRYPLLARLLVEMFEARFDPATGSEPASEVAEGMQRLQAQFASLAAADAAATAALKPVIEARSGSRERQVEATRAALLTLLDRVSSLDEDRIIRSFIGVIDATLRTSYYLNVIGLPRADGEARDYVSYKLDSALVPDLPKPRPYREIFVYAPGWKACTCASDLSRAADCDGRTDARTSARKCWAWQRRRWSRTRSSCPWVRRVDSSASSCPIRPSTATPGSPRAWPATSASSMRCSTSPTTSSMARWCIRHTWCGMTAMIPTWSSRPTRARLRFRTSPTPFRVRTATGSTMPSPRADRSVTTTRPWASPPRARGNRSSAISARWAAIARRRISPSSASATCPVTCSATACCCRHASGCWRPSTIDTFSWTRRRRSQHPSPSAAACSSCRVRRGRTTTPR